MWCNYLFGFIVLYMGISYVLTVTFLQKNNKPAMYLRYIRPCESVKDPRLGVYISTAQLEVFYMHFNLTLIYLEDWDDRSKIEVELFKWCDGGWKKTIDIKRNKGCSTFVQTFGSLVESICKEAKVDCTSCPMKKGNYTVRNYKFPPSFPLGPLLAWPGVFQMYVRMILNNRIQSCYLLEFEIKELLSIGDGLFST